MDVKIVEKFIFDQINVEKVYQGKSNWLDLHILASLKLHFMMNAVRIRLKNYCHNRLLSKVKYFLDLEHGLYAELKVKQ